MVGPENQGARPTAADRERLGARQRHGEARGGLAARRQPVLDAAFVDLRRLDFERQPRPGEQARRLALFEARTIGEGPIQREGANIGGPFHPWAMNFCLCSR